MEKLNQKFERHVDQLVRSALRRGAQSYADVLRAAKGAYPGKVWASLQRCGGSKLTDVLPSVEKRRPHSEPNLPLPHPLDFDWRFTPQTAGYLLNCLGNYVRPSGTVGLLGTPSVFVAAMRNRDPRHFFLFDRNANLVSSHDKFVAVPCEIGSHEGMVPSVCITMMDPPWYEDYYRAFLYFAAKITIKGGHVITTLPPLGTRPNIIRERARILKFAESLGLALLHVELDSVVYESPLFEVNALKVSGTPPSPRDWRRGDLVTFRLVEKPSKYTKSYLIYEGSWDEICIGGVRIRIRKSCGNVFNSPLLKPIVPGDIVPSVSRRNPLRKRVDVWTSGNRAFSCRCIPVVRSLLQAIRDCRSPESAAKECVSRALTYRERIAVRRCEIHLRQILKSESLEMTFYAA